MHFPFRGWPLVAGFLIVLWMTLLVRALLLRRRRVVLPPGEEPVRTARRVSARVFVSRPHPGSFRPGRVNHCHVDLLLSSHRLRVGGPRGRILELPAGTPFRAACTGPRRLVLEVERSAASMRLEMVAPEAEAWAQALADLAASRDPPREE